MSPDLHQGKNVLVWGALGFLGQHLVEALLARGANVSVLTRPRHLYPAPDWADRVTWHELNDADDDPALSAAVSQAELIYNLAGSSGAVASNLHPFHSLNENCAAQLRFLQACEEAGHRPHVVFASSWLVYDIHDSRPVSEDHALAPRSLYGAHKLCIENYLRIYQRRGHIRYTICRISNPYGCDRGKPTRGYKMLNTFVENALAGVPLCLFGDGSQLRDFIHISDLTEAFLLCALPQAENGIFNIGLGRSHSLREAAETIGDIAGSVEIVYQPWPHEYECAEPGSYRADTGKARTTLGFAPTTGLREGLKRTIHELRGSGAGPLSRRAGA